MERFQVLDGSGLFLAESSLVVAKGAPSSTSNNPPRHTPMSGTRHDDNESTNNVQRHKNWRFFIDLEDSGGLVFGFCFCGFSHDVTGFHAFSRLRLLWFMAFGFCVFLFFSAASWVSVAWPFSDVYATRKQCWFNLLLPKLLIPILPTIYMFTRCIFCILCTLRPWVPYSTYSIAENRLCHKH